jgi:hypothetical protein
MHCLEHEAITAERHNNISVAKRDITVARGKLRRCFVGVVRAAGDDGNPDAAGLHGGHGDLEIPNAMP